MFFRLFSSAGNLEPEQASVLFVRAALILSLASLIGSIVAEALLNPIMNLILRMMDDNKEEVRHQFPHATAGI